MNNYRKKELKGYNVLNMYPVYSDKLYEGHQPFKIVGIRQDEVELEGDFSGGTHCVNQREWFKNEDCFVVEKLCNEQLKEKGCQIHNVNCCGGSKVIDNHLEYWKL